MQRLILMLQESHDTAISLDLVLFEHPVRLVSWCNAVEVSGPLRRSCGRRLPARKRGPFVRQKPSVFQYDIKKD